MKKHYTAIGGLTGGILAVLLFLVSDFVFPVCTRTCPSIADRLVAVLPITWALREILLFYFIGGLIIGALLGLVYGKVEKKNSVVSQ